MFSKILTLVTIMLLAFAVIIFSYYKVKSKPEFSGTALKNPVLIQEVKLKHVELGDISFSNWQGNILLVFFGFTHCPDVCPLTLGHLAKVYLELGEPKNLQVIMISVDPKNDTPEIIQKYVANFHKDFIGLSGSDKDIIAAAKNFFVGYKELPNTDQFIHTDSLAVIDSKGYMRIVYNQSNISKIVKDLAFVLKQKSW